MNEMTTMPSIESLLQSALRLPNDQRAILVERIYESLDDAGEGELEPEEWQAVWTEEINRRTENLRSGRANSIPGEQVMAEANQIVNEP